MNFLDAICLGVVQGLTEFLPVSSSAHLKMVRHLLGIPGDVLFDLVCHTGTLIALCLFLRKDIWEVLKSFRKMTGFAIALVPLVPGYFLLKGMREALSQPEYLGGALCITGALLWASSKKKEITHQKKWQHVLCIGSAQTMALIPGISRSGSTVAMARFCGWEFREAVKFSYLLAIPTILGGEALEWLRGEMAAAANFSCYAGGFIASFGLGLLGVRCIFWVYENIRPFAWYCFGVGLLALVLFHG